MGFKFNLLLSTKSSRKSIFRRRLRPSRCNIMYLPPEIIHKVLIEVGACSFRDYTRAKAVCRSWMSISEQDPYYHDVDLFEMQTPRRHYPGLGDFKVVCLQHGNFSALYLLGLSEIFRVKNREEGMRLIRQAAEGGYDLAIYARACLDRIMNPSDQYDGEISRTFVLNCRRKLHSDHTQTWMYDLPQWFREIKSQINISSVQNCDCTSYLWWIRRKGRMTCDRCFWTEEIWYFADKLPRYVRVWPN